MGGRYRFGASGQALRPYVELAVSRTGVVSGAGVAPDGQPFGAPVRSTGYGLTAGAGVEYYISPRLGLDLGLVHTRGRFNLPGDRPELTTSFAATRIRLGVTWRP